MRRGVASVVGILVVAASLAGCGRGESAPAEERLSVPVRRGGFVIKVTEVGVVEAVKSVSIANPLRRGEAKLLKLIPEGTKVSQGDFLAQFDPTPFEERVEHFQSQVADLETELAEAEESLTLSKIETERDEATAKHAVTLAELELEDVERGSGRQTLAELETKVREAKARYERERERHKDIEDLYKQEFVSTYELSKQKIAMDEAKSDYDLAQAKYDIYTKFTLPAQKARKQAALAKEQGDLARQRRIAQRTLARERSRVEKAKTGLARARQRLEDATDELTRTHVTSPVDGYVIYGRTWDMGSWRKIREGDSLWRTAAFLMIPDLSSVVVKTRVREVDVHQVERGQRVTITMDAFPDLTLAGQVDGIGTLALKDPEMPTPEKYFDLTIKLDKTDPRLRPGMTARVEILIGEVEDALVIPSHAVFVEEGNTYCYVMADGRPVRRRITVGRQSVDEVEVLQGVLAGEAVYLAVPAEKRRPEEPAEQQKRQNGRKGEGAGAPARSRAGRR
jgi:HlyD family secretion protein